MPTAAGVLVRKIKEKVYAQTGPHTVNINDKVIVETEHGIEFGIVCEKEKEIEKNKDVHIGTIVRIANENDMKRLENNELKNKSAYETVRKKIAEYKLDMKLTVLQYTFDRTKLFIYYTSDTRVDFRELIKDLGKTLKTRIQMVQIGVRDESKIIGGIGMCGKQLCCQIFLKDFSSVTIDMAKEQDLSLNTSKLSGVCGRLMCCLSYEHEQYAEIKKNCPEIGSTVATPNGTGKLISINCIKETAEVEMSEHNCKTYKISQLRKIKDKKETKKDEEKEKKEEQKKDNNEIKKDSNHQNEFKNKHKDNNRKDGKKEFSKEKRK